MEAVMVVLRLILIHSEEVVVPVVRVADHLDMFHPIK